MVACAGVGLVLAFAGCGSSSSSKSSEKSTSTSTSGASDGSASGGSSASKTCNKLNPDGLAQQFGLAAAIPGTSFTLSEATANELTGPEGEALPTPVTGATCTFKVSGVDVWTVAQVGIYEIPEGDSAASVVASATSNNQFQGCDNVGELSGEATGSVKGVFFVADNGTLMTASFPIPVADDGTDLSASSSHSVCTMGVSLAHAAAPQATS
jgi:hypothetical protein